MEEGFGFINDVGEAVVGVIKDVPVIGKVVGGAADFAKGAASSVANLASDAATALCFWC